MTMSHSCKIRILAALLFVCVANAESFQANTKPWKDVELRLLSSGAIRSIAVERGSKVAEGDLLIQLDDDAEQAQLQLATAEAENGLPLRNAELVAKQRKAELERLEKALAKNAIAAIEVDRARLAAEVAVLEKERALFEGEQAKRNKLLREVACKRMQLRSPFAGVVEQVQADVGEHVGPDRPVILLVDTSVLAIDASIRLDLAKTMTVGQTVNVTFLDGLEATGKVTWMASIADSASFTRGIRVEFANETNRPAGERVTVTPSAGNAQ